MVEKIFSMPEVVVNKSLGLRSRNSFLDLESLDSLFTRTVPNVELEARTTFNLNLGCLLLTEFSPFIGLIRIAASMSESDQG